jgi:acyl-CoA hydrolase
MPHDKFGQLLAVGDLVLVRATVREITTSSDFCNVKVETVEKMDASREAGETLWLNAKQVEKERPAHLRASSSPDAPVGPQPWPVE